MKMSVNSPHLISVQSAQREAWSLYASTPLLYISSSEMRQQNGLPVCEYCWI